MLFDELQELIPLVSQAAGIPKSNSDGLRLKLNVYVAVLEDGF